VQIQRATRRSMVCNVADTGEGRGEEKDERRRTRGEEGSWQEALVCNKLLDRLLRAITLAYSSSRLGVWIERCCICTTDVEAESHRYTNDSTTEGEKEDNVSTTTATVAERGSRGWPLQYQEGDTRASAYTPDACRGREVQTKKTLVERGGVGVGVGRVTMRSGEADTEWLSS